MKVKLLEKNGWYLVAQKGNYKQYKHLIKSGRVTYHGQNKDLAKGTKNSILKQAKLK